MIIRSLTAAAVAVVLTAGLAQAQEAVVPAATGTHKTVADVLKNPVDDEKVNLKGYVVKKLGGEKYTFKDDTGEIRIEIDNEDLPAVAFDDKTLVELIGEVEKDYMVSPEIDVDVIKAATP
jgi:uncharacterized protein (TIGR00156 family)